MSSSTEKHMIELRQLIVIFNFTVSEQNIKNKESILLKDLVHYSLF